MNAPVKKLRLIAFWNSIDMRFVSFLAYDCPTSGVSAIPIPCPKTSAMVVIAAEKATPAKGTLPNCPTMSVSKNCTTLMPSEERIIGYARRKLSL